MQLRPEAQAKFCKARPAPLAIRAAIDSERAMAQISWDAIAFSLTGASISMTQESTPMDLDTLLKRYEDLFSEKLGTIHPFHTELQLHSEAWAKICKARPAPLAIRAAIDSELDRLEAAGIIEPVAHSDWVAPVVVVPIEDGKIRLCGDYKVSINPALEVEQYPLP